MNWELLRKQKRSGFQRLWPAHSKDLVQCSKSNNCIVIRKILLFTCDRASHSIKLVLNAKIFTIYWFLTTLSLLLDSCIGKGLEMIGSGWRGLLSLNQKKPVGQLSVSEFEILIWKFCALVLRSEWREGLRAWIYVF